MCIDHLYANIVYIDRPANAIAVCIDHLYANIVYIDRPANAIAVSVYRPPLCYLI